MIFLIQKRFLNLKNKTPLHCATENDSKEVIELLIQKGANINVTDLHFKKIELKILIIIKQIL